jgi:broad specificity phosphatase PhoE
MKNEPSKSIFPIFLGRHAAPGTTPSGQVYHLPPGPSLSDQGVNEARHLAVFSRLEQVKMILCSPLERCMQTARIVQETIQAPIYTRDGLKELQPQERPVNILERSWPVFLEAVQLREEIEGPVLVLTHGGVVHILLMALGLSKEEVETYCIFDHHNPIPTAGAWEVLQNPDGGSPPWLAFAPDRSVDEILISQAGSKNSVRSGG